MIRGTDKNNFEYIETTLNAQEVEKVLAFTKASYPGRKPEYLSRRRLPVDLPDDHEACIKCKNDIFSGTCGELAITNILNAHPSPFYSLINQPDLNVYDIKNKSYASDLKILHNNTERKLHIKTRPGNRSLTWLCTKKHIDDKGTLKKGDPLVNPELKYNNKDLVAFMQQVDNTTYRFYGLLSKEILLNYLSEPYNQDQKNSKTAFYFKDFYDKIFLPKAR
jgi:hypothetical protein